MSCLAFYVRLGIRTQVLTCTYQAVYPKAGPSRGIPEEGLVIPGSDRSVWALPNKVQRTSPWGREKDSESGFPFSVEARMGQEINT